MNRFEFTDHSGGWIAATPGPSDVRIVTGVDGCDVEPGRVEEVVAGIRDMTRQTGGQPAPLRRRLTEPEHDRAWHAIEDLDWETADPDTVLNAVLAALGIDPPFDLRPGAPITPELKAYAAAVLPPGARIAAEALRDAARIEQDDFGLATDGPGPTAVEGAGA